MVSRLMVLLLVAAASMGQRGADSNGSGAPPQTGEDPTPFEQFEAKLKLDSRRQTPEVVKIFTAAAADATPVSQEMIQLRLKMVSLDGKPDELGPVMTSYTAAAAKMTGIEIRAFQKVYALLDKNQQSKSAEAFVIMAGIFHPPTPRTTSRSPRGGGDE